MGKSVAEAVEEILSIVRTEPPHVYWHGLEQRRPLFAHIQEAIPLLLPALADPSSDVRRYVARLIRDLDRETAARVLAPALGDPDDDVRLEAAGAVLEQPGWHGRDPPRPPPPLDDATRRALSTALEPLLSSRKLYVRDRAIEPLEMTGSFAHVPLLLARLPEPDWNHRGLVFRALRRSPNCVAILGPLLDHEDADTRAAACLALSDVETLVSGSELAARIVAHLDDAHDYVRSTAAICIGRRRLVEGEAKLVEIVGDPTHRASRSSCITALGWLRSPLALPVLLAELAPGRECRGDAIRALAQLEPRMEIEEALLRVLVDDPDVDTKNAAAQALGEVGTARAVPALEHFLAKEVRRLSKRSRKEAQRTLPFVIDRLRQKA